MGAGLALGQLPEEPGAEQPEEALPEQPEEALPGQEEMTLPSAASPEAQVTVRIMRSPELSLQVVPRGVGVCKQVREDCEQHVTWSVGPGSSAPQANEHILIRYKSGASDRCFESAEYRLDQAQTTVESGSVREECPTPSAWFYVVELYADDVLVTSLDPGVIIDQGG